MAPAATLYSVGFLSGDDTNIRFRPVFTGGAGADERAHFQQQLELRRRQRLRPGGGQLRRGGARCAAVGDRFAAGAVCVSAGNEGNGDDTTDPGSGTPDSIDSPATAKNVITVGAIQEIRNITNTVTNADGTISAPWHAETSTSLSHGRFFQPRQRGHRHGRHFWAVQTGRGRAGNVHCFHPLQPVGHGTVFLPKSDQLQRAGFVGFVQADRWRGLFGFQEFQPTRWLVTIQLFPNGDSPVPLPRSADLLRIGGCGDLLRPDSIDQLSIPPDGGLTIPDILGTETSLRFQFCHQQQYHQQPINFDFVLDTITTNGPEIIFWCTAIWTNSIGTPNSSSTGPGPYYRYETGTSMSAADVSGVLALMQDFSREHAANAQPGDCSRPWSSTARTTDGLLRFAGRKTPSITRAGA
jgi:hypothetical protein